MDPFSSLCNPFYSLFKVACKYIISKVVSLIYFSIWSVADCLNMKVSVTISSVGKVSFKSFGLFEKFVRSLTFVVLLSSFMVNLALWPKVAYASGGHQHWHWYHLYSTNSHMFCATTFMYVTCRDIPHVWLSTICISARYLLY